MTLVYCLHGDELITENIAKKFKKEHPFELEILLGNPKARASQVRYLESDLNRSFNHVGTYEAQRAQKLKKLFLNKNDDLVLDLHTTTTEMPPLGIITNLNQLPLAARLGIKDLVLMSKKFSTGGSLIENVAKSISIEIFPNKESIKFAQVLLVNALDPKKKRKTFNVYEVTDIVKKVDNKNNNIKNFSALPDGSYPIFYGEKAYKDIAYLKTTRTVKTL